MTLSELAIGWLGEIVSWVRARIMKRAIKVKSYIKDLIDLEGGAGATTEAWSKIAAAANENKGATLTAEEARYLYLFKALWDKYFKSPLKKLAAIFADDE